jgi:hypothetical protein
MPGFLPLFEGGGVGGGRQAVNPNPQPPEEPVKGCDKKECNCVPANKKFSVTVVSKGGEPIRKPTANDVSSDTIAAMIDACLTQANEECDKSNPKGKCPCVFPIGEKDSGTMTCDPDPIVHTTASWRAANPGQPLPAGADQNHVIAIYSCAFSFKKPGHCEAQ